MLPQQIPDDIPRAFHKQFGQAPQRIAQAPGRINLIGEHTDYNGGWVLPAAIDKLATVAVATNGLGRIRAFALDMAENFSFRLGEETPHRGWQSYVLGVLSGLHQQASIDTGLDILLTSNVPQGAGLSSSAALECAIALAVDSLLLRDSPRRELARICQMAEHDFAGVQCGIMDQYASLMGRANHAFRLDCRRLIHTHIPLELGHYTLLLCHTNVSHSLADSEYNSRRQECAAGVALLQQQHPEVQELRDVDEEMLRRHQEKMDATTYLRCLYVVQENARVHQAVEALSLGHLETLGRLLYASHQGLSQMYQVSCPELDFLVDATRTEEGILGARMMGGGFGGCTLNIIRKNAVEGFVSKTALAYQRAFSKEMAHYAVNVGDGASVVLG